MLAEEIITERPIHIHCRESLTFMAKFNWFHHWVIPLSTEHFFKILYTCVYTITWSFLISYASDKIWRSTWIHVHLYATSTKCTYWCRSPTTALLVAEIGVEWSTDISCPNHHSWRTCLAMTEIELTVLSLANGCICTRYQTR